MIEIIDGQALVWRQGYQTLRVEPWGPDSLRVRAADGAAIRSDLPQALLGPARTLEALAKIGEGVATLRNGAITAELSEAGHLRFLGAGGEELLAETEMYVDVIDPPARWFKSLQGGLSHLDATFCAYEGERLYGLGQQQHGLLDQKGCVIDLIQRNTKVSIPFLLSSRGYGFLWNNPGVGRVELGVNRTRWTAEATRQMDYWITAGATPAAILRAYADATGHAPDLPEWASGFWQCKLRYRTQEELLEVAREYKRRGLPLSVIVADFFHWTLMGDWRFDPEMWPDPAAMTAELAEMGVKLMVSIWPTVNARSENFAEMQERGYLAGSERGVLALRDFSDNVPSGKLYLHFYDATNPDARTFVWDRVKENYFDNGVRIWWLDADEPEIRPVDPENVRYHLGNGLEVGNLYPMLHAKGFYDGMRAAGETEIVSLSRSAWAGSQRFGAAVWSGDIPSTFASLRRQIPAGLNIGLSGIPWWTTDIGGFHDGNIEDPSFRELIVRWFQYGVFCPLFRLHGVRQPGGEGTGAPNEVWSFGDEVYAILQGILALRERLRPYVMAQMAQASEAGMPAMRPLFVDFPDDPACGDITDAFMFGPDLLVAPVVWEGARSRDVYLPACAVWTDAWTGATYAGGQTLTVDAPLERIPLYLRDGARLPIKA